MPMSSLATTRSSLLAVAVAAALCPAAGRAGELPAPADPLAPDPQSTPTLDTVRVYGRARRSTTVDDAATAQRRLDERAGGTALVDGDAWRGGRVSTLADALGHAPGVFVQPRFGADEARLSIRGSGLQRTFHGRGLALLQDGSPLNLADGGFDFQAVEPLAARYVEIYRGANALEYGASSLGGAINFVSPTGHDAPPLTLRGEAGAFGYRRGQVALAGATARADGYVSVTGLSQDGYRDHAVQETYRLFANAGVALRDDLEARFYATRVDTRSELPGNLTFAEFERDPRLAAPANVAQDQRRDYTLSRIAAKLAWTPRPGRTLTLSAFHADKDLHHPIFQVLQQASRDAGVDLRWRGEGDLGGHRNVLTLGLRAVDGEIDDDRFLNVGGTAGARTNRFDQRATDHVLYAENQTWLALRWVLSVGAQGLRAARRSRDLFVTGGRDESFDTRYSGASPKLGLRYVPDQGTQLFANVSRSLEPPSFGELTGGPGVTPVDMQRAVTAEAGVRLRRDTLWLDAAAYRARIDGELLALTDAEGNPRGTVNADRTLHQGLEVGLAWAPTDAWRFAANYLHNAFRFDGDAVYGDNVLAGVPRRQLRAEIRWNAGERFQLAPSVEWVPDRYYVDHANTVSAPGYAVWSLRTGGAIGGGWRWFADLRNAFDRRWIAGTNVVADAGGRDGRNVLPGEGRALHAGIEFRP